MSQKEGATTTVVLLEFPLHNFSRDCTQLYAENVLIYRHLMHNTNI